MLSVSHEIEVDNAMKGDKKSKLIYNGYKMYVATGRIVRFVSKLFLLLTFYQENNT